MHIQRNKDRFPMPLGESLPTTETGFFGERLRLRQPARGYRAGGDPILLAAAIPAKPGETVLDLGCGVGTAGLCLLARQPELQLTSLELQPELALLARMNAQTNGFSENMAVIEGCLLSPPPSLQGQVFDHVITNPPWMEASVARAPANASKSIGHIEGEVDLAAWLEAAVRFLKHRGRLAIIHRADRMGDLLAALNRLPVGAIKVFPLWPRQGEPAIRIIVTARKNMKTPLEVLPGLVLHENNGQFTAATDEVLRQAASLF